MLDLPKNSSKIREAYIISGPQLNIIAVNTGTSEIFSKVIAASKCGSLARKLIS